MPDKYKNKYTIKSARLEGYDYSQEGMYFVTICTKDRKEFFGRIDNGKMILSGMGEIIKEELLKTPIIRPNVILNEWIIMPNHLHAVIEIINKPNVETPRRGVSTPCLDGKNANIGETNTNKRGGYNPQWKPNSLGSIINQFKSVCTKKIWKSGYPNFAWQPRFYDHIIRDEISLYKIKEYIRKNPEMWERDRNNADDIWI